MLYFFYGEECPHCHRMTPLIDRLEKENNVQVTRLETWHDEANTKKLAEFDANGENCGGVPYFYNEETQEYICGETGYDELKSWALGE